MATIVKSNNAFAGASTLSNVSVVTKSAQDLYDEYAARVVADGGVVADPTECLAVIQSALDHDYYWRTAYAISPKWGRKVSAGNITKLYNLVGTIDAIAAGTVALNSVVVAGEDLAEIQAGDTFTLTGVKVLAEGADGLAFLSVMYGAASGAIVQTAMTPAAEQWLINGGVGAGNVLLTMGGVTKYTSSPEYTPASLDANCIMVEMSTQRTTGFQNGLLKKVTTPSGGFTALVPGVTANIVIQRAGGSPYSAERWLFNDASGIVGQNAMMNASQDSGDRF
jgi:hypothetical protein